MSPFSRRRLLHGVAATGALALASSAHGRSASRAGGARWKRTYGSSDYQVQALAAGPDDAVLLVGRTGSSNADAVWLAAVAPDGTPRWTTTIDASGFPRIEDAAATDDGYLLAGTAGDAGRTPWLVGVDAGGTQTWDWLGPPPAHPTTVSRVGDAYAVSGYRGDPARPDEPTRAWIRVVDANGAEQWEREYDATHAGTVRRLTAGYLTVGAAASGDGDDSQAWLAFLSEDGDVRDEHAFGGTKRESANALVAVGDGELAGAYAGSTASPAGTWPSYGFVARTDADGRVVWRRTYDVAAVTGFARRADGFVLTGEPHADGGRDPEKPLVYADRWGRVEATRTTSVATGAPVDLARFENGRFAVAGWSERGPWVAAFPATPA